MTVTALCRDCLLERNAAVDSGRCPACGSPRLLQHPELGNLSIAHIDCDAFYASVEKRDDPSLRDKPVIVGGGHRGVVSAACYVARLYGVRSAMPMFQALKACPDAVVIRPDMAKYSATGLQIRAIMKDYTPLVEPLSIDEAFLDLNGTEALHKGTPARTLALIVKRIEAELGVNASIGLSYNKFLAKVASDLDKPRGFAPIGKEEAVSFLAPRPTSIIWGGARRCGKSFAAMASPLSVNCNENPNPILSAAMAQSAGACIIFPAGMTSEPSPPLPHRKAFPLKPHSPTISIIWMRSANASGRSAKPYRAA